MPKMVFIERDGTRREVDAPNGLSVLEIAHKHGLRCALEFGSRHPVVNRLAVAREIVTQGSSGSV